MQVGATGFDAEGFTAAGFRSACFSVSRFGEGAGFAAGFGAAGFDEMAGFGGAAVFGDSLCFGGLSRFDEPLNISVNQLAALTSIGSSTNATVAAMMVHRRDQMPKPGPANFLPDDSNSYYPPECFLSVQDDRI